MKIKDYKCKCGHNDFFFVDKGSQKGIYCTYCGKWLKWADKDERNLIMKQGSNLDKIKGDVINIADGKQSIKVSSVLRIIDKYKPESEDKE